MSITSTGVLLLAVWGISTLIGWVIVWRKKGTMSQRLMWSGAALIPLAGPLACQILFDNEDESAKSVGRNDPCPCGSGKKYKKCCLPKSGS